MHNIALKCIVPAIRLWWRTGGMAMAARADLDANRPWAIVVVLIEAIASMLAACSPVLV
ncbi:hypothetical protein K474DRAFT_1656509 [Panus rudis PR-1116 ss-1]|nr:hypothetical protein K474DRAFT_1656509 [Panus rudis PR-1116 ss-1]